MGNTQQKCGSSESNTAETLKEDIMVVLLLPILCGVYSFLHWFILVPLLWTAFAHGNWNATSFLVYEIVAFAIWVVVIVLLLNMKCCKKKETHRAPQKNSKDSSSHLAPHFQTRAAHVQPKDTSLFHEPHVSQSGYNRKDSQVSISLYSIPVQPQSAPSPPSNKNLQKAADVFSESPSDILDTKSQANILHMKENMKYNSRHSSLLVNENANGNGNLESRDDGHQFERNECDDSTPPKETVMPNNDEKHEKHSQLSREESFVGLPEMNSFGSYLQLVTVDTPFSPSEQFFPDTVKKVDTDQTVQLNQSKEAHTHETNIPQIDSPASEEGDTCNELKHIPNVQHNGGGRGSSSSNNSSSNSTGSAKGVEEIKTGKRNSDQLMKDDDEVFTPGAPVLQSKLKESIGECFIADVRKTESLTSEVFISVSEPSNNIHTGDTVHVNLPSDVLKHDVNETNVCEEGQWAVLK